MKIQKIEIRNYRSIKEMRVHPESILALVGRNNSGKSNVVKALELFFEGSVKLVNEECFHNHKPDIPIEIYVTFGSLSEWEKEKFGPWLLGEDKLVVGRKVVCQGPESYVINNMAIVAVPELDWLRDEMINSNSIKEWWAKKDELKIGGSDFGAQLGESRPGVGAWKEAAKQFIEQHRSEIPWKEEKRANPKGYPGVLKGALPEFIHIPAVRDVLDEAKVAKTNPFGQLINSVLEKISDKQKQLVSERLKEIERLLNRSKAGQRIAEIKEVETRLNQLMSGLMECDVEIEMTMPKLKEVFGAAKIFADDGVRTTIETKGHGLQRSMIFTILRAYAEFAHVKKAGEKAKERSTIFAIEEPELYLHPQSQRTLMSVFRNIASGRDQVIYTTHSSLFIDISHFDEICIMRRQKKAKSYESRPTQLCMSDMLVDLKARKGVEGTEEGIREQYSHAFNPMVNEGFFATKVVIVEGPSEQYSLPIYADALGYNLDQNNVSVVHSHGKGPIDRLFRMFNGFEIPTYLWFDGDKDNQKSEIKAKTLELLELSGDPTTDIRKVKTNVTDQYAVLEHDYERTLKEEIKDYESLVGEAKATLGPVGQPLIHRFIANKLKQRVDKEKQPEKILPKSIVQIVGKVRKLTYSGSILKKCNT
jgi:predicted ATP-dependent endonuclease of OLD family